MPPKRLRLAAVFVVPFGLLFLITLQAAALSDPVDPRPALPVTGRISKPADLPAEPTIVQQQDYAYVNVLWNRVGGHADPGTTVNATLERGGNAIATASATADAEGQFTLEFSDGSGVIDLVPGDDVLLQGGGVDATLHLISIEGAIDVTNDAIIGQASGGTFPAQGVIGVGSPTSLAFVTETVSYDQDGNFSVSFSGKLDIQPDHVARVDYADPNGNRVVEIFFPEGMDIRVLISQDRVEGVARPGTEVALELTGAGDVKGEALVTANEIGFFSSPVLSRGHSVDIALGDHVSVKKLGSIRELDVTMYHVSYIQPWNNRVVGTIHGVDFPTEEAFGRVDLWSTAEGRWYTQYVGVGSDGSYGADWEGIVEMSAADLVRVWATAADGTQQAALGWALDVGASTNDDVVYGHATVGSTAYITLYRGFDQSLLDIVGTATALVDHSGFFSTTLVSGTGIADVAPTNVVAVQAGEHYKTLYVGMVEAKADPDSNIVIVTGPPGSVVHLEGRRPGVLRRDAPYQDAFVWREVIIGPNGRALASVAPFDLQVGDWFDLTAYVTQDGLFLHNAVAAPEGHIPGTFLPLILK
jgi:hypothetical protein